MSWFKKGSGSNDKKLPIWLLLAGGMIGIALILFGAQASNDTPSTKEPEIAEEHKEDEVVRYQEYLEARIEELCSSMGLGEVSAIVTVDGSFQEIYATEQTGERESYVIVGSGSSAQPILLSRSAPEIMGIGVVCREPIGSVRQGELLVLLSNAFSTPTSRISVTVRSG